MKLLNITKFYLEVFYNYNFFSFFFVTNIITTWNIGSRTIKQNVKQMKNNSFLDKDISLSQENICQKDKRYLFFNISQTT